MVIRFQSLQKYGKLSPYQLAILKIPVQAHPTVCVTIFDLEETASKKHNDRQKILLPYPLQHHSPQEIFRYVNT